MPPENSDTASGGEPSHGLWLVGRVGRPVGRSGECVVHPVSSNPEDLDRVARVPVRMAPEGADPLGKPPRSWRGLRHHGDRAIAQFEGIETREAISEHTHWRLWVDPRDLPVIEEPETWWVDELVGFRVVQVSRAGGDDTELGEVVGVSEGPSCDHLEIALPGGGRAHIPFLRAFLRGISPEQRLIRLDLPEGLIEH